MKLIGNRPLCTICLCMILSAAMGIWMPPEVGLWMFCGSGIGCGIVLLLIRLKKLGFYTGCMAICLLIALPSGFAASSRYYAATVDSMEAYAGESVSVEGTIVARKWSTGYGSGYLLRAESLNGEPVRVRLLLECEFAGDCRPGEYVRVTGTAQVLEDDVYGFAERQYYLSRGVVIRLEVAEGEQLVLLEKEKFSLSVLAERLNTVLAARLRLFAGEEAGDFFSAVLLGRREALGEDLIKAFRRLGMSHLLALSGLHLSLLTAVIGRALRLFGLPRAARTWIQLVFVVGYVLLTGAPISVVRAALMLCFSCLLTAIFAEADSITSLFCAAAVICTVNPASLLDIGFWMSVFATFGMLICQDLPFASVPAQLRPAAKTAVVTIAANLITLPFVALSNGEFSWLSLAANLIFVPLISVLLCFAPFFLLGGGLLSVPIGAAVHGILSLIRRLSMIKGITLSLRNVGTLLFLLPFLAVWAVLILRPPKRKWLGGAALFSAALVFWGGANWINTPQEMDVVYTHIGQSEMIVCRHPGGTVICDMGTGAYTPLKAAAAYAADLGAAEIDVLMLTHYHTQHIGAFRRFADSVALYRLLLPRPNSAHEWEIAADLEEIAESVGTTVVFYTDSAPIVMDDLQITPHTRTLIARSTQPLLLLRFARAGKTLTYIGASVGESELAEQAAAYASESDYLILGDHGPNPRQCVIWRDLRRTRHIILASTETLQAMLPEDLTISVSVAERIWLTIK